MKRNIRFYVSVFLAAILVFGFSVSVSRSAPQHKKMGIACDFGYYIFVADPINSKVHKFDMYGHYLGDFIKEIIYCKDLKLVSPVDISTCRVGNTIGIVDATLGTIVNMNPNRTHHTFTGDPERHELLEPYAMAKIGIADDIGAYVIDRAGNKLVRYDPYAIDFDKSVEDCNDYAIPRFTTPEGYEHSSAPAGNDNEHFNSPEGVVVDVRGYVLVADTGNKRILKYRRDGEFVISTESNDSLVFDSPTDVSADRTSNEFGYYYVADSGTNIVTVLDGNFTKIGEIGNTGENPGQNVFPPEAKLSSVEVDSQGFVWVSDIGTDTVYKFTSVYDKEPLKLVWKIENATKRTDIETVMTRIPVKKYFAYVDENTIPIKPYAQVIGDRLMVPIKWLMDNIFTRVDTVSGEKVGCTLTWNSRRRKQHL